MKDRVLLGVRRWMVPIPRFLWRRQIRSAARKTRARLASLPDDHTVLHYFCVSELPRAGEPLVPTYIAERLHRPVERVNALLEDLEERMTFLYRDPEGAVAWAYPVTADETPHQLTFGTGERINAA
jgi:hypothetical protein